MEDFFKYFTPITYWLLTIMWLYIFIFFLKKIRNKRKKDKLLVLLLLVLSIDAFKTLFESIYFGAWYTSLSGLIPIEVFNFLAQPQIVFFPKIINLITAFLVLIILINRWLPSELIQKNKIKNLIVEKNSELLEKNKELILAKDKAEESDRLKSSFLANMSHEIRTPMNGILGFLDILNESNLSKTEINRYLDIISSNSNRLLNTINDIIDISKIEAGEILVSNAETSINNIMDELFYFHTPEANKKGLSLLLVPSTEKISIITDSNKLHGILTNLINNATKYTEKGSITFGYSLKKNFIEFFVNDTGIGIPKNRIHAVFNRFEQADIGDTKAFEGSGLGLAISKAYVEMLGGEIFVESTEGKGSKFIFTIPYIQGHEKKIEK